MAAIGDTARPIVLFSLCYHFFNPFVLALPPVYNPAICSTLPADVGVINWNQAWPKGYVPYDFTTNHTDETKSHVFATMRKWEKYTCIRFVPWVAGTTKATYGLPDEGHLLFKNEASCSATAGNAHDANGQHNSCCKRGVCVHELGHSLGFEHEHRDLRRADYVEVKWETLDFGNWRYYEAVPAQPIIEWQYDLFSKMHYGNPSEWRYLYEDLRRVRDDGIVGRVDNEILIQPNHFYMYKDASRFHDCAGLYCSTSGLQCLNDGFVSVVDGVCSCLCPDYFDPKTSCATTVKEVKTSLQWPAGDYAFMASTEGCPAGTAVFTTGTWQHTGNGYNTFSPEVNLGGSYTALAFQHNFCVKSASSDVAQAPAWDLGRYCILRAGGQCPAGFKTGWVQYDDAATGSGTGSLPDGVFGADTRLEFCCRDDGFRELPLQTIPNTQPLILFNSHYDSIEGCQQVAGMRAYLQHILFDSYPGGIAAFGGEYPDGADSSQLYYCYYVPLTMNCGGEITLTSTNNQAVITSPNYPSLYNANMECAWYITTDNKDDIILLNFNGFSVTSSDSKCRLEDALEIRYGLIGQPGPKYCGNYIGRTVRSFFNTVVLVFRTDNKQLASDTGFSVTATLFKPATDECYEPSTKGVHYRGTKDYTRSMRPCLHWAQAPNCNHSAFDVRDFGSGLDKNFCRNPDFTAKPWCYTDTSCERDYCDVCNIEAVYDREHNLCSASVCSQSRDQILALGCAATCNLAPPAAPSQTTTCGVPNSLPDASILGTVQSTYLQGASVTYKCNTGNETAVSTCMSDGQWSATGYVCGGCKDGWAYYSGACYRVFDFCAVTYLTAQQYCASQGAFLSTIKDATEHYHLLSISRYKWEMFFGLNDIDVEGTAMWEDGTPLSTGWSNWYVGVPWMPWGNCAYKHPSYDNATWIMKDCNTTTKRMFACKYNLSAKTASLCVDRTNCTYALTASPDLCVSQPVFADQQCPYSCGVCLPDSTPRCSTQPPATVQLVSPLGVAGVSRGATVTFSCLPDLLPVSGMVTRACGHSGSLIGPPPVCTDVGDSNNVELKARPADTSAGYAYLSRGSVSITRNGVIKQWKYYSSTAGKTNFQVWRPDPVLGFDSAVLVGQNEVMTQGTGVETYDVPDYDWIQVQPGDGLAVWEPMNIPSGSLRLNSICDYSEQSLYPTGYSPFSYWGDFSRLGPVAFSNFGSRVFSYKAVVYGVNSVPANRARATSQVTLVPRSYTLNSQEVWFGSGPNFVIPTDGYVSSWQFHNARTMVGNGAMQVWRLVDQTSNSYKLMGQNMFTITNADVDTLYNMTIANGERIAVKAGDVVAVWSGSPRWGVTYSDCSVTPYQDSGVVNKKSGFGALGATPYTVETFTNTASCYVFSFRAVVSQDPTRTVCSTTLVRPNVIFKEPQGQTTVPWGASAVYDCTSGYVVTSGSRVLTCGPDGNLIGTPPTCELQSAIIEDSNSVALIARSGIATSSYAYMGVGAKVTIQRTGVIKQWKYYSLKAGGMTMFQVWRPTAVATSYQLIGQVQVKTLGTGETTYDVPQSDWIVVQPGDHLAIWESNTYVKGQVGYTSCVTGESIEDYGIKKSPSQAESDFSLQIPTAGFDAILSCRIFSFKAVIHPLSSLPAQPTNRNGLFNRITRGNSKTVYFGTGSAFKVKASGFISNWQFYVDTVPGDGAFQVWRRRPDLNANSFQFIGQNVYNGLNTIGFYNQTVPAAQRVAVQAGDLVGLWYGLSPNKAGIRWTTCNPNLLPDGSGIFYSATPFWAETEVSVGQIVTMTPLATDCYIFSFRAVVATQ